MYDERITQKKCDSNSTTTQFDPPQVINGMIRDKREEKIN
jgi:hypothetical protein